MDYPGIQTHLRMHAPWKTVLKLVFLVAVSSPYGSAQEAREPIFEGVSLPSNRRDTIGIQRVQESMDRGEFTQAVQYLDDILGRQQDSFVTLSKSGKFVGLKKTVQEMLRDLPEEARLMYETTYEPVARRLLKKAIADGDLSDLRSISERFYHTPSGYEATLLFARLESDRGRHQSAALIYERLLKVPAAAKRFEPLLSLRAGLNWLALEDEARARSVFKNVVDSKREIELRGSPFDVSRLQDESLDGLLATLGTIDPRETEPKEDSWLTLRGNPQRNGMPEGGLPHLRVDWNVRLLGHPALKLAYEELALSRKERQKSLVPVGVPLAVGDFLVTRSAHNLIGIDFETGKRVWQTQTQRFLPFESLINGSSEQENAADLEPVQGFAQRIWDDSLFSTISSDGERVFAIRDLEPARFGRFGLDVQFMGSSSQEINSAATNRLCAYDLETQGKLVWEVDGASNRTELGGVFFLGAPLAVGESLFCIVEKYSEKAIYLVCLEAKSGKLQWQQQLVNLENGILGDYARRLDSTSPSYDEGLLICPTGAGVVVGYDLIQDTLAWAYPYQMDRRDLSLRVRRRSRTSIQLNRWVDSTAKIANGHLLLSPSESDSLHCLKLDTGELVWKQEYRDGAFVAGIHEDFVLVVSQKGMQGIRLKDGGEAWSQGSLQFPDAVSASGQGFLSDGKYYLPLTNAEVLAVDASTGQVVDKTVSREGKSLGNLICYRGTVISQNGNELERFGQIEVLKQQSREKLLQNPEDHVALRTLGEMAHNSGYLSEAIDLLSQAFAIAPEDLQTRDVLSQCLQEALDEDFGQYRQHLALLERIQSPDDKKQLSVLRLKSQGLFEIGELLEAFSVCEEMVEAGGQSYQLMQIGRNRQVTLPRWIRAQVLAIWNQSDLPQREEIVRRLSGRIAVALDGPSSLESKWFLDCFGALPICEPLVLSQGIAEVELGNLLSGQQILLDLCDSDNELIAAQAVAMNSLILHNAEMEGIAIPFDKRLETEFADIPCFEGKTGREFVEQWNSSTRMGALSWPSGMLSASAIESTVSRDRRSSRPLHVEVQLDQCDEVLSGCNILLGHSSRELLVRDSEGRSIFRMALGQRSSVPFYDMGLSYGVSRGNLLVVSSGHQYMAVNTLFESDSGVTKPLWKKQSLGNYDNRRIHLRRRNTHQVRRPGSRRASRVESDGKWVGVIGPVTHDSCVIQNQTRLVCMDPISGELRWVRTDVPAGCDLFGDSEFTFAVERNSLSGFVFSTIDGRELGECRVPLWNERLTTLGHDVVVWKENSEQKRVLSSVDILNGQENWKYVFHESAAIDIARGRYAVVVDTTGRCIIVDVRSGELLVESRVERVVKIDAVHLIVGTDHYTIALQTSQASRSRRPRILEINKFDFPLFDGHVYVFKRSDGQPSFEGPATVSRHGLMLSQPADLPLIPFVSNQSRQTNRGGSNSLRLTLLERGSGRLIYTNEELPISVNHFAIRAPSRDSNRVIVEMMSQDLSLEFTDRPRPPEPPFRHELYSKGSKGIIGIAEDLFE